MKQRMFYLSLLFSIFTSYSIYAQDIKQILTDIQSKVGEIQIDKITYKQTIDVLDDTKGKIRFSSVATDDKGKATKESYEFYVSDIDKNTIIRKTSGKKLLVNMWINNKQKFIKTYKDDVHEGYVDNLEMLVSDADAAQGIIDLFKKAIPLVKMNEKSWTSAKDALAWLQSNIGEVSTKTGRSVQTFSFNDQKEYMVIFKVVTTDTKGATIEENFEMNIADINKNNIQLKISGAVLSVQIETKGGNKYIKYNKNNQLQNYTSDISVLSDDIDHARQLMSAFTAAVEKSKPVYSSFTSVQQATDFIKNNTVDQTIETKTLSQRIEFNTTPGTKTSLVVNESDGKGKTVNNQFDFYLADIDKNTVNFKVSGKKILLVLGTTNKVKLIKYQKDNIPQNFQNDLEIACSDIETARGMIEAFNYAAKGSEVPPAKWGSVTEVVNSLQAAVKGEAVGSDKYELGLEADLTEPFQTIYTEKHTDAKGVTTEGSFVFYPFMLDPNSIKIEASGKYLTVSSLIKNKKAFVKKMKGEVSQGFDTELEIMAFDAKQAKDIVESLKYFAANYAPKERDWSDKNTAMNFVKETVGNFSNANKEVKQALSLVDNEPCKVNLTVTTTDDKGKTLEEVFEFSLADMNKLMVEYKVKSNNVYVTMVCKNKEKFVKVYKNGVQQTYASDIEIVEDDVDTARNLADALRSAVIACEKQ
jgi:hypothetical protein